MEETKTYSWKQLLMVSSLIFGMFFGSGNLIFPVHLGQMAGSNWISAGVGFAISGALFPLLAILAVVVTKSDGLYDLAKPVGKWYAALFLILVHLTIGPFFGTPRTAATAFEMAAKPFLPEKYDSLGMFFILCSFLFTCLFPYCTSNTFGQICRKVFKLLVSCIISYHFCRFFIPTHGESKPICCRFLSDERFDKWRFRRIQHG